MNALLLRRSAASAAAAATYRDDLPASCRKTAGIAIPFDVPGIDSTKIGAGDIQLRTKYTLIRGARLAVAPGLVLRLPAGEEENFHGIGDVTVTPLLVFSFDVGPHTLHLNIGVEANADDLDRTRGRYGIGATFRLREGVAALVEVTGNSGFTDAEIVVPGPERFVRAGTRLVAKPTPVSVSLARTDVVDLASGLKIRLGGPFVGFAGALVPLTPDGVRAAVIPSAGIEATF